MEDRHLRLCWPNYVNGASIAGGSWESELPVTNVGTSVFAEVAQSRDTALASTRFTITLPRSRTLGVVALANHNCSEAARWRVRTYYDAAGNDLAQDSGWRQVWPRVYASLELPWEAPNFWSGAVSNDERDDFTSLATHWLETKTYTRRVSIEIDDGGNPDGRIRIGRAFVADVWMPDINISYGVQYGHDIQTEFEVAGDTDMTEYADPKTPRRTVTCNLDWLSEEEAFARVMAMQRRQGLHGEILYAESPKPSQSAFATTFLCRQTQVDALANPYHATFTNTLSFREIL